MSEFVTVCLNWSARAYVDRQLADALNRDDPDAHIRVFEACISSEGVPVLHYDVTPIPEPEVLAAMFGQRSRRRQRSWLAFFAGLLCGLSIATAYFAWSVFR